MWQRRWLVPAVLCAALAGGAEQDGAGVAQRRQAVLAARQQGEAGLPVLTAALADPAPLVRRAAVRILADLGPPARPALETATGNDDSLVRRAAYGALLLQPGEAFAGLVEKGLKDPDEAVRVGVVAALLAVQPRTEAVHKLIAVAAKDASLEVRRPAQQALWPYHKETVLFRQRPDVADQLTRVTVVATIPIPADGWLFRLDPEETGHHHQWFAAELPAEGWAPIRTDDFWQKAGYDYAGVAWYRRTVKLPERPAHQAAELRFGSVDECAWVWLNGQFVGQHDLGPEGWNVPFALDATPYLKWGADNQLTVRVLNTKFAGGIYKPVDLDLLTLK